MYLAKGAGELTAEECQSAIKGSWLEVGGAVRSQSRATTPRHYHHRRRHHDTLW